MKNLLISAAILLPCCSATDLNAGVMGVEWFYYADRGQIGNELQQGQFEAELSKPIQLGEGFTLTPSLLYQLTLADRLPYGYAVNVESMVLHAIEFPVDLNYRREGNPWFGFLRVAPGLSGDFEEMNSDSLFVDVRADVGYRFNDSLQVGVGMNYARWRGEPEVLPDLSIDYRFNDQLSFVMHGASAQVSVQPGRDWIIALKGEPGGGVWQVESQGLEEFSVRTYRVGLSLERRLCGSLWVTFGGGLAFGDQTKETFRTGFVGERKFDQSCYLSCGLRLMEW